MRRAALGLLCAVCAVLAACARPAEPQWIRLAALDADVAAASSRRTLSNGRRTFELRTEGDAAWIATTVLGDEWTFADGVWTAPVVLVDAGAPDGDVPRQRLEAAGRAFEHAGKAQATTLGDVLGKEKALLLDFWASWCGPCMELMPELRKKAAHLADQGIVVAGMNTEGSEAIAQKVGQEKGMSEMPWLVEPQSRPFSEQLDITSIPRMVLISPQGKVLFNGHPRDPALWSALKKVDAKIEPMKAE